VPALPRRPETVGVVQKRARRRLICAAFVVVFVLNALSYAYFFVDDEAIPFVYAQNVLDGHGLVYNPDDGPVEGYSDFVSVWIDVGILWLARVAGEGKVGALALAKLFSFACGIAVVVVTFAVLSRRTPADGAQLVFGMAFLTLAGPLGVWSWSALETTLFALIIAILTALFLDADHASRRKDGLMLLSIVAALLCRSDGFVWVGALVSPFLLSVGRTRRRELVSRVVVPALVVFAGYHLWRLWYFGELLSMPLYAKVLYKLGRHETLVSNDPPERYVFAFLKMYGWIPIAALCLAFARAVYRSRNMRSLAIAVGLLILYLGIVGDWMFGFRFWVPLLAPMAILAAGGVEDLTIGYPRAATACVVIWSAVLVGVAYGFERRYEREEGRQSWLAAPSFEPARFFAPYYEIYLAARPHVGRGDTIAYNQAGFVPFMLGARNIDDLGICTKFYAKLPTTDVVFTEAGRYSPLTGGAARRASETYTVSRAPQVLLVPGGNLRAANGGAVPPAVLGGAYRLLFSSSTVVAYVPAGRRAPVLDSREYLENLVHISHLRRASLNGRVLPASDYRSGLPYLYGGQRRLAFEGRYVADFNFSDVDEEVYQLFVGGLRSAEHASVVMMLTSTAGRVVYRESFELMPHEARDLVVNLRNAVPAAALSITITPDSPEPQAVDVRDVRVQGQTPALKQFLRDSHAALD
jgi:hypothetical protein